MKSHPNFVVATPARTVCDHHARVADREGWLRLYALGTRRGTKGISKEKTRLFPAIGLASYVAAKLTSSFKSESFRFRLHPLFDAWVRTQLQPGDFLMSSYGYVNSSFAWVRKHGGKTILDGGNSHPKNFWDVISEEHRRWNYDAPPIARHHYERSVAMMDFVDYVFSPSSSVTNSCLERGFSANQIFQLPYPVNLDYFTPPPEPRPKDRPLSVITTGSLSLRKGTPYLLEAMRIVRRSVPNARLLLTKQVFDSALSSLERYQDLEIDWADSVPLSQLAPRLHQGDIFVLPSLEEGFARTVTEALACGLPVITTPNSGSSVCVIPGRNGSIIPIRDPDAIAQEILRWWEKICEGLVPHESLLHTDLSEERFATDFCRVMRQIRQEAGLDAGMHSMSLDTISR